jgi:SAM-dependent methyltransferase/uncharacterized protein YbaR (Trm112 family)
MDVTLDPRLVEILTCPRDKLPLREEPGWVTCAQGHRYRVVEGIPILLLPETEQTHVEGSRSLAVAVAEAGGQIPELDLGAGEIDPFVQSAIASTNGSFYQHLVGNLTEYPIPRLRLPAGNGKLFLEIGCNWGRWCIAAARIGYRPVGIDPSLKGIRAARRAARQLNIDAHYLVADGRYLPFADGLVDQIFSYSVLQHLSKENARAILREIRRVLRAGGRCEVQMPNVFGIRCLYHQMRRGFRETRDFEVRYWTPGELASTFREAVGPARVSVDGYFSLNPQISDLRFLPRRYRAIVRTSETLRKLSRYFPPLLYAADSLYITATRNS